MTSVLEIQELTVCLNQRTIIKQISLTIQAGELVLLSGDSGVGKSTLLHAINGYYPKNGGRLSSQKLSISNTDLTPLSPVERSYLVRTIFQNARLSFVMETLRQELLFSLENISSPKETANEQILKLAQKYHIEELLDRTFQSMSGGELQKCAFACASLVKTPLLLMDEPFANLDEETIPYFQQHIQQLLQEGYAILVIDHRTDLWRELPHRHYKMISSGKLMEIKEEKFEIIPKIHLPLIVEDKPIIEASDLSILVPNRKKEWLGKKSYTCLLENIHFQLYPGELVSLTGKSGIGKTSLFKVLLGLQKYQGNLTIQERDWKTIHKKQLFQQIGIVYQDPSLQFVKTTVLQELVSAAKHNQKQTDIYQLLSTFDLAGKERISPWLLSQGQQRKLAVLTMLISQHAILLVDEPTYGQDFNNAIKIMDSLVQLSHLGVTCLYISHDKRLTNHYAHRQFHLTKKGIEVIRHAR